MKNIYPLRSMKLTLLICLLALLSAAQSPHSKMSSRQPNGQPITSILNADGTIKRGISGSFDPKGFRMSNGPDGSPRFVSETEATSGLSPTTECNDGWDDRFWTNGLGGGEYARVYAMASDGAGNIYVGGVFTVADNVVVTSIAKWNGSSWSALGTGLINDTYFGYPPRVQAIAVSGSDVYVGGVFTSAGGVPANNIAKWNGSTWSALGSGTDDYVTAIAVAGTEVYAGGGFTTAGDLPALKIAKWNGSSWSALGSGVNEGVTALAVLGSDVYVGGLFTTAGGLPALKIAKWNGSSWSALGSGASDGGYVYALAVSGTDVYVSGGFGTMGGIPRTQGVAKWNGTSWSALGSGLSFGDAGGYSYGIAVSGSDVYTAGSFTIAGGVTVSRVAKWNGSSWSTLGSGTDSYVTAIAVTGTDVYLGGTFFNAGGIPAKYIAKWNGSSWSAVVPDWNGLGIDGEYTVVFAVAVSGSDVYVAGRFTTVRGVMANNIAKWNGSSWSALGSGTDAGVNTIAVSGSDVFAGGYFTTAGGVKVNNIAKWNGSSWSALGAGTLGPVYGIAMSGSDIYAAGYSRNSSSYIAKWNGFSWSDLGTVTVGGYCDEDGCQSGSIYGIAVAGPDLYVGGLIAAVNNVPVNNIAKWNGSSWSPLGSGIGDGVNYSAVRTIAVSGTDVYVGGGFTTAGGLPARGIAKWNGSSWSALGSGITVGTNGGSPVSAIIVSGSDVYAGGYFTSAGGVAANNIAKWNGSTWSALGSGTDGVDSSVLAMAVADSDVYVGGHFSTAGCHAASNFSRYSVAQPVLNVSISGRVMTPDGRGLRNATVSITDSLGVRRTVTTSSFGFYRFDYVAVGPGYVMAVSSRLYRFAARTVDVNGELTNEDFVGLE